MPSVLKRDEEPEPIKKGVLVPVWIAAAGDTLYAMEPLIANLLHLVVENAKSTP
jgi:hypothetical protein